jgi:hypothetical protein
MAFFRKTADQAHGGDGGAVVLLAQHIADHSNFQRFLPLFYGAFSIESQKRRKRLVIFLEKVITLSSKLQGTFHERAVKMPKNKGPKEREKGQNAKITLKGENPIDK